MESNFWIDRWRTGQTGFHQAAVEPKLVEHLEALALPAGAGILVPLCGKSVDLLWLANQGLEVTGVELSSIAVEAFWLENGIPARRGSSGAVNVFAGERLRIFEGDFFALEGQQLGPVAAVYDRASLIAWPPERRRPYVEHLSEITPPGAKTLLMTLEYPEHETKGPPFSVSMKEVSDLYGRHHEIDLLSREDILATDARMRARGVTQLHQSCYLLRRL